MPMSPQTRRLLAAGAGAVMLAALPLTAAHAAKSLVTFSVTAQVSTTCFITTTNLNFGAYAQTQLDATTTLSATCSNGTPYDVGLDAGTSPGATVSTRKMTGLGSDLLNYSLFQDSARSLNWGNTVGTDTVHGVGNGAAQTLTVYGRIPAAQFVAGGEYSDTITVSLNF